MIDQLHPLDHNQVMIQTDREFSIESSNSSETRESWEIPTKKVLDSISTQTKKVMDWLIKPPDLTPEAYGRQDNYYAYDLPFPRTTYNQQFNEASRLLAEAEDAYHGDIYDPKKELTYRVARSHYEESLMLKKTEQQLSDHSYDLSDIEVAYENNEIIEWELKKVKMAINEEQITLENCPPQLKNYFDFLKNNNKNVLSNEPAGDLGKRKIFWVAVMANLSTFFARNWFGYFPFPHFDKISDVSAYLHEMPVYGMFIKNGLNFATGKLNEKILSKKGREVFLYKSLTRQDVLQSMAFYGGLWITSEVAAWHKYSPIDIALPGVFTADPADLPAHAAGMAIQWGISRELIKRFPPGRFIDMETAVAVKLSNLQKRGVIDPTMIWENPGNGDENRVLISTYKKILKEINTELKNRSMDVRDYSKRNPEQKSAYNRVISTMTRAMARRWLLDQLQQSDFNYRSDFSDKQFQKFIQYKEQSRIAAVDYRRSLK